MGMKAGCGLGFARLAQFRQGSGGDVMAVFLAPAVQRWHSLPQRQRSDEAPGCVRGHLTGSELRGVGAVHFTAYCIARV